MSGNVIHPSGFHGKEAHGGRSSASDDQKLFIVVSVATATACFLVNTVVIVAILSRRFCLSSCRRRTSRPPSEHRLLTSDALHLSQAVAGILASAAAVYPIEVIAIQESHKAGGRVPEHGGARPQPDLTFFTSRAACYMLASAPLLSTVLAALGTNTLMALEQHLLTPALRPQVGARDGRKLICASRCGVPLVPVSLAAVWLGALLVPALPIMGPGSRWLGFCMLPGAWTDTFTAVVASLMLLLVLIPLYLYAGIFAKHRGASPSVRCVNGEERGSSSEEVPICEPPTSQSSDPDDYSTPMLRSMPSSRRAKANFIHFCLLLICYVPVAVHLLSKFGDPDTSSGIGGIAALLERDSTLPWAALLVVVAGVASPLVYLLVDDELPGLTMDIARAPVCKCCWSSRKNLSHKPVSMDSDDDDGEEN